MNLPSESACGSFDITENFFFLTFEITPRATNILLAGHWLKAPIIDKYDIVFIVTRTFFVNH